MNFKNYHFGAGHKLLGNYEDELKEEKEKERGEKKTRVNGIELPNRIKTKPCSDFLPQKNIKNKVSMLYMAERTW